MPSEIEKLYDEHAQEMFAFLLNFTKFVDWPPAAATESPFTICIFGDDPFGRLLDQMVSGETVGGRKLVIQRIGRNKPASCQIVFAGRNEKDLAEAYPALAQMVEHLEEILVHVRAHLLFEQVMDV